MFEINHNDWNPIEESTLKNQRQAYDKMRDTCPVAHSEFLGWSVFAHDDIVRILANPDNFSNESQFLAIPNGIDPPAHGRYREMLNPNFSPGQLTKVEALMRDIARLHLDLILHEEEAEFIHSFVTPFAMKTLCGWLGWPQDQWTVLDGWVKGSQKVALSKDAVEGKALADFFAQQVKGNLNAHRTIQHAQMDATDALLSTEIEGVKLEDDQIVSVLRNWVAGHGTMAGGLGILIKHLAQDITLQNRLRTDPLLIPSAIEEILRVDGPLVANPRTTTREVTIQNQTIPKGQQVRLMWMAANRDPKTFHEPQVVKLDRNTEASLVWGQGIHLCQGAPLARLEMRVALEELLSRTKCFELASAHPGKREVYPSNGFSSLSLLLS